MRFFILLALLPAINALVTPYAILDGRYDPRYTNWTSSIDFLVPAIQPNAFKHTLAVQNLALSEINQAQQLFPGVTIKLVNFDQTGTNAKSVRDGASAISQMVPKPLAIIGPNVYNDAVGVITTEHNIVQIAPFGAPDDFFSDKNIYPTFLRNNPSTSSQAPYIANIVIQGEWSEIMILGNTYYNPLIDGIATILTSKGVKITADQRYYSPITTGFDNFQLEDISSRLQILKTKGTYIIVGIFHQNEMPQVLDSMDQAGLIGGPYVLIGNDEWIRFLVTNNAFTRTPAISPVLRPMNSAILNRLANGVIGTQFNIPYKMPQYQSFLSNWNFLFNNYNSFVYNVKPQLVTSQIYDIIYLGLSGISDFLKIRNLAVQYSCSPTPNLPFVDPYYWNIVQFNPNNTLSNGHQRMFGVTYYDPIIFQQKVCGYYRYLTDGDLNYLCTTNQTLIGPSGNISISSVGDRAPDYLPVNILQDPTDSTTNRKVPIFNTLGYANPSGMSISFNSVIWPSGSQEFPIESVNFIVDGAILIVIQAYSWTAIGAVISFFGSAMLLILLEDHIQNIKTQLKNKDTTPCDQIMNIVKVVFSAITWSISSIFCNFYIINGQLNVDRNILYVIGVNGILSAIIPTIILSIGFFYYLKAFKISTNLVQTVSTNSGNSDSDKSQEEQVLTLKDRLQKQYQNITSRINRWSIFGFIIYGITIAIFEYFSLSSLVSNYAGIQYQKKNYILAGFLSWIIGGLGMHLLFYLTDFKYISLLLLTVSPTLLSLLSTNQVVFTYLKAGNSVNFERLTTWHLVCIILGSAILAVAIVLQFYNSKITGVRMSVTLKKSEREKKKLFKNLKELDDLVSTKDTVIRMEKSVNESHKNYLRLIIKVMPECPASPLADFLCSLVENGVYMRYKIYGKNWSKNTNSLTRSEGAPKVSELESKAPKSLAPKAGDSEKYKADSSNFEFSHLIDISTQNKTQNGKLEQFTLNNQNNLNERMLNKIENYLSGATPQILIDTYTLDKILSNERATLIFKIFLIGTMNSENLSFCLRIKEYKKMFYSKDKYTDDDKKVEAINIFETFFTKDTVGFQQLNLNSSDYKHMNNIINQIKAGQRVITEDIYDNHLKTIEVLIATNSMKVFYESRAFRFATILGDPMPLIESVLGEQNVAKLTSK